jgi:hypothetical protein
MKKLDKKPKKLLTMDGNSFFKIKKDWYSLHLNGDGYHAYLVDGRSVYHMARKKRCSTDFKTFNLLEEYKQF